MHIEHFPVGPLQTNCYVVSGEPGGPAVIIDPGGITPKLINAAERTEVTAILLTHGHFDHTAAVDTIVRKTGAPVWLHPADREMLTDATLNGSFLMGMEQLVTTEPETIDASTVIRFGKSSFTVIETPGHSRGGVTFVSNEGFVFAGDTLFKLSVGRWDLYGGDLNALMASVRTLVDTLPPGMTVYPGHGEPTTIGFERDHNDFLKSDWR